MIREHGEAVGADSPKPLHVDFTGLVGLHRAAKNGRHAGQELHPVNHRAVGFTDIFWTVLSLMELKQQGLLVERTTPRPHLLMIIAAVLSIFAAVMTVHPAVHLLIYFFEQDLPILCAMLGAAILFFYLHLGVRWQSELRPSRTMALVGGGLIVAVGFAGRSLVMLDYDLSRDEALASLAASQILSGSLITAVPSEWQLFGHAMLPNFTMESLPPDLVWTSAYLPINSSFQALVGMVVDPALANPLLLAVGLFALWKVATRLWPDRKDAALVVVLLAATSSQLIAASMTSYAMTGHFALNMMWLALFLRGDKLGVAGALLVGFLAIGLHQLHFHPLFAAPFLLQLATRRQWGATAAYALGYLGIGLFWWKLYPELIVHFSGISVQTRSMGDIWLYIVSKIASKFNQPWQYSLLLWQVNLFRFAAWQNLLLLPLALAAIPLLQTRQGKGRGPLLSLCGACVIGLALMMVYQGPGWGYRYLHGLIGCFCLLAGYGWCRIFPEAGPSPGWAMIKFACAFALLVLLPIQLAMARAFVAPPARLNRAILAAPADVVLVDVRDGLFAWDIVQNGLDFDERPKIMDLSLVPEHALASLCQTKRVLLVDRRHYQAVGMPQLAGGPPWAHDLEKRRALLQQLRCAPPLKL